MGGGEVRSLEFEKLRQAVQIKLTDTALEALLLAQKSGTRVMLNVGRHNELLIGSEKFPFRAHEAALQDVVCIPANPSEPAREIGHITQRIHVQRTVTEAERERVRLRGLEAENLRKGRTAQVLDCAPKPGEGLARKRVNVAAKGPAAGKPTSQLRPSPLPRDPTPNRNLTPPTQAPPAQQNRTATPPPSMVNSFSKGKTPSLSKFGKSKRPAAAATSAVSAPPELALEAARQKLGLRRVLIACIATDRPKKPRLDQMLKSISGSVSSFKFSKEEVTRMLKEIADYKAPGVYVLTDYVQRRELAALQRELETSAAAEVPSRTPSVEADAPAAVAQLAARATPGASPGRSPTPHLAKRSVTPTMDFSGLEPTHAAAPASAPSVAANAATGDKAARNGPTAVNNEVDGSKPTAANRSQQRQTSLKAEELDVKASSAPPEEGQRKKKRKRSATTPLPEKRANAVPAPAGQPSQALTKAAHKPNAALLNPPAKALQRRNESGSSAEADTRWFEDFVRPPRPGPRAASSRADFDALFDEHERLYDIYKRLGHSILRFKREYESLVTSAEAAALDDDKRRVQSEAEQYYIDRVEGVRAMDKAFKTIHAELIEVKAGLSDFYDRQNQA